MKAMWSPSKRDLLERVKNELVDCDFCEADVERYFEIFSHDLNALKGRSQNKRVHHESMLQVLDDDQVLLSGDIMHTAGNMFMVIVMLSKEHKKSINNLFVVKIQDREAVSTSAAMISVGKHIKARYGYKIGGVEFVREKGIVVSKELIEREFECKVQFVSTHACYAETAIKLIKQRVRIVLSMCTFSVNNAILCNLVVAAVLIINSF